MDYRKTLLSPIKIGNLNCENRFFANAMECVDADKEGNPTEKTLERYAKLFGGRFGMVDLEAITITGESRSRLNQLEIMPQNVPALRTFVKKLKEVNPKTILVFQLTHSGELSHDGFSRRVTPKPLPGFGGDLITEEEVDKMLEEFVLASKIVQDIGGDGIDMKFCHGYLGNQMLRPYNDRKWKYGGSWENRSRFAFELYERISRAVNSRDFLIGSKVSLWEGFPGGFGSKSPTSPVMDMTEPVALIKGLEERGAQYFVETIGHPALNISYVECDRDHTYLIYLHTYFANLLKSVVKPETVVVGSHYSVFKNGKNNGISGVPDENKTLFGYGAQTIDEGIVDMIALGRQSFADPHTPLKLLENRESEIKYCLVCLNCLELMIRQQEVGCAVFNKYYTDILTSTREKLGKVKEMHT